MLRKPSTDELEERLVKESYNLSPILDDNKRVIRKLVCVLFLALLFMSIEIAGGIIAGSIAILSDAAHMLSDLLGFIISIISIYISGLPANSKHSYGYHRAGVIGALASVMVIWALTVFLIYEAVERVINIDQIEVDGKIMFGVACFGLLTNLLMMKVLHGDHSHGGHDHGHSHGHSHGGHSHSHFGHSHSHGPHEHKHGKDVHPHKHGDVHDHKHDHDHDHDHDHAHDHEHKHDHEHEHHDHAHEDKKLEEGDPLAIARKTHKESVALTVGSHADKVESKAHVHRDEDNLNVRATVIHILGDILQSIGVIIASILVWINPEKLKIADPIITFVFAIIVLCTTLRVVKDCIFLLMEGTPSEFNLEEFEESLRGVDGVAEIHDLHVWSLGVGKPSMSAHLYTNKDTGLTLKGATKICRMYGIFHSTIQVETTQDKLHEHYIECEHNIH